MTRKFIDIHKLPFAALEINKNREIIDLNKPAKDIGVVAGTHCWDTYGKRASIPKQDRDFMKKYNKVPDGETMCIHCKADKAIAKNIHIVVEEKIGDTLWEIHWVPTGQATYIHYGIDITKAMTYDEIAWLKKAQKIGKLGNWSQDVASGELFWSEQTYRLFGMNPQKEKMTFDKLLQLVDPDDREVIIESTKKSLASDDNPYKVEYRVILSDNDVRDVYEEAEVERDGNGIPIRMFGIIQDITERKSIGKELNRLNGELELRIEEKTYELVKKNIALAEILSQLEIEKQNIANKIDLNVQKLVLPILNRLIEKSSTGDVKYLLLVKQNLENITSSLGDKLSSARFSLTLKEIEICAWIKGGLSTKEIALLQNLSDRTVETHRFNIRNKLGINSAKINLASHLQRM